MAEPGGPRTADAAAPAPADVVAFRALLERWFDPCVDVAWQVLHDADAAADVAQDTFFAAWHAKAARKEQAEAGRWVLRAARDGALGRLASDRHGGPSGDPWPSSGAPAWDGPGRDPGSDLLRAVSAALGEADASVLDLHLRHGFDVVEVGDALGVPRHDAQELLLRLKRRLGRAVRAWALWRDGRPDATGCPELREALATNGVRAFGPEAVTVVARHAKSCEACQDRQRLGDTPEALVAAVPVVPAGTMLAARTASTLAGRGVPIEPTGPTPTGEGGPSNGGRESRAAHGPTAAGGTANDEGTDTPPIAAAAAGGAGAAAVAAGAGDPVPPPPGPQPLWTTRAGPQATPSFDSWAAAPTTVDGSPASTAPQGSSDSWAAAPTTAHSSSDIWAAAPTAAQAATGGAWAPPGGPPLGDGDALPGAGGDSVASHLRTQGAPGAPRPRRALVAIGVAAAVLLLGGVAFALTSGGDDTETAGPDTTEAPGTTAGPATTPTSEAAPTTTAGAPTTAPSGPGPAVSTTATTTATTVPPDPTTTVAVDPAGSERPTGAAPSIAAFDVVSQSLGTPCEAAERRITLAWTASGADGVSLSGPGAPGGGLPASGRTIVCRPPGDPATYTLTATGPGGTDTSSLTT